jgi:hypothetical protein
MKCKVNDYIVFIKEIQGRNYYGVCGREIPTQDAIMFLTIKEAQSYAEEKANNLSGSISKR